MAGVIYVIATPLGNLEDITLRALRLLREADVVACEDTRRTGKLLAHFGIRKPLLSCHEHNEQERAAELVRRAQQGERVAVVSDAGMPGISDPGYRVVREAIEQGVDVAPVPGPVAAEAALAASGLPTDAFRFGGFLPSKKTQRRKALEAVAGEAATLVYYEAPHRILRTLEDVREVLGERPIAVARELTKMHEEFIRGPVSKVIEDLRRRHALKGEMTIVIGRGEQPAQQAAPPELSVAERVAQLIEGEGLGKMAALKQAARERGISKREAYQLLEREAGGGSPAS